MPSTIETPYSEVGIPLAYVSGAATQTVTVTVGNDQDVSFSTVYEPTITVNLDGPLEPGCVVTKCPTQEMVYDNDAVAGTTVTVTPSEGTSGAAQTCQARRWLPGRQRRLRPALFVHCWRTSWAPTASRFPRRSRPPIARLSIPVAYVTGQNPQSVTLSPGRNASVNFTERVRAHHNHQPRRPAGAGLQHGRLPGWRQGLRRRRR